MRSHSQTTTPSDLIPVRWILGSLILVTLWFQPTLADPFNSPKLWLLIFFAAWLIGYIYSFKNVVMSVKPIKRTFRLILMFLGFLILSTLISDFRYVAIFGDTQRRNGFLQYLALSVILIATSIFIRTHNVKKIFFVTYLISIISVIYSLMQTTGNDFVNWNNQYNAVISTLGNPNFAAAAMAIMGVLTFSSVFIKTLDQKHRFFGGLIAISLLFVIYRSNARQGLISYILGVGVFIIIWIWDKNKKLGFMATMIGFIFFVISILGMLQTGPLEKYLYKESVSIRGYYWRAGIEMFKNHPFFGVGIDSYGYYFKEFREVQYPLTYGYGITSSNAHNTFIQLFATGGLLVGMAYLILNAYIFKRAVYGINNLTGNSRLFLVSIFSAWIAFHSQSFVSIDNIGISIWGWILGGSIIGLSLTTSESSIDDKTKPKRRSNEIDLSRGVISGFTTLIVIFLVAVLYRGESNSFNAAATVNLQNNTSRTIFKELQLKVINSPLNDPNYRLIAASRLIQAGFVAEGLGAIDGVIGQNPRNLDALNLMAMTQEQLGNLPRTTLYREKIAEIDPWNAANYLALGEVYKAQGNTIKTRELLDKIQSFASSTPIAEQAIEVLSS
jgi:O-antigen ligase